MVFKKYQISPQYINERQITTTILNVVNPAHFIIKESPSLNTSSEAKNFVEAEESMQKYYESIEPSFFQMPLKDTIVVVLFERKFYRAKVVSILTMSAGHMFKVYLLDYGKECSVPRECIFENQRDFLIHPFQAVNFKLLGMEPISLVMSSVDLSMSYGPVTSWDPSAEKFICDLRKGMCSNFIEVEGFDEQCIYGNLFMTFGDGVTKCINDELVANRFARFNETYLEKVQKIKAVKSSPQSSKTVTSATPEKNSPHQPSSQSQSSRMDPKNIDLRVPFILPSMTKSTETTHEIHNLNSPAEAEKNLKSDVKVQPTKIEKNLQTLQKLRRLRHQHHNLHGGSQTTKPENSPTKTEENASCTVPSLSPSESSLTMKNSISNDSINSKLNGSNTSDFSPCSHSFNSNVSNESVCSTPGSSTQHGSTSVNEKVTSGKLSRLQKLQRLKQKKLSQCLQTSEKLGVDLNLKNITENVSAAACPKHDSSLETKNLKEWESTQKSSIPSPKKDITLPETSQPSLQKHTVDFQK